MKRCLVLLLALPLIGCYADQQQQLGRCIFDAGNKYPQGTWLPGRERQSFVWLCMAANGYQLNRLRDVCSRSLMPMDNAVLFAQCYEPIGKFAFLIHKFELALRRPLSK
jgi:hypothetical protein